MLIIEAVEVHQKIKRSKTFQHCNKSKKLNFSITSRFFLSREFCANFLTDSKSDTALCVFRQNMVLLKVVLHF
jgi:hypothetical protein